MVSLATNDATQGHQRVVLELFGQCLQCDGHFQCARDLHQGDVFFFHAQSQQFGLASQSQGIGDVGVEARLDDADGEVFAVQSWVGGGQRALVCDQHGDFLFSR
ncbi:MAG: hypothetical protein ACD_23C01229G0001 [uncultured bacterium]|nr:MAG: hypothetical protein ACD_23C01229G0001 [uncultured bacterium]